jgi:hypothetical protein
MEVSGQLQAAAALTSGKEPSVRVLWVYRSTWLVTMKPAACEWNTSVSCPAGGGSEEWGCLGGGGGMCVCGGEVGWKTAAKLRTKEKRNEL